MRPTTAVALASRGWLRPALRHQRRGAPRAAAAADAPPPAPPPPAAPGRCTLVGAGPGPADLLTLRAARALAAAEVVVYDDLGAAEALALAPAGAERIYVGKRGGRPSIKQPAIDALLVELCLAVRYRCCCCGCGHGGSGISVRAPAPPRRVAPATRTRRSPPLPRPSDRV